MGLSFDEISLTCVGVGGALRAVGAGFLLQGVQVSGVWAGADLRFRYVRGEHRVHLVGGWLLLRVLSCLFR